MKKKVTIGLSGGVDSAVAAMLLKEQGYDVTAVFMKNWEEEIDASACTAAKDFEDVRRICDVLEIPYYSVNFAKEYMERVFKIFLHEYEAGRTPNPDVLCNSEIKFKAFLDFALQLDAEYMATGHYARVGRNNDVQLLRGVDHNKDQSYFLCMLDRLQLEKTLFPLGELEKSEVRILAKKANLPVAEKKDSTGICFIGERQFREFITSYIPKDPGDMVDIDAGRVMGRHEGLFQYTIGQRKGIGLGGVGSGEPWFVVQKDIEQNILYIAQGKNHPALFSSSLVTEPFHFINGEPPSDTFTCTAKFRYRQADCDVIVKMEGDKAQIEYPNKQRAVTPGQYAVLYQEDVCLGGGIIEKVM